MPRHPLPLRAALLLIALAAARAAYGDIISVTPVPGTVTAGIGQSAPVLIRWQVSMDQPPAAPSVTSTIGRFRDPIDATVIATVTRSLSKATTATATVIPESLLVPQAVLVTANRRGHASVLFERDFDDGFGATASNLLIINIGSGAGAAFGIGRMALGFEDGSLEALAAPGDALRPRAVVNHSGSGTLRAVWEVAEPASTGGVPVFRVLQRIQPWLGPGGEAVLVGPRLPTTQAGLHLVRLRITDPVPGFEVPQTRYVVGGAADNVPRPIALTAPAHLALLAEDTRFAWTAIPGTRAYRLELYHQAARSQAPDAPGELSAPVPVAPGGALSGAPSSGLLVPGTTTVVPLSALARTHLAPGQRYLWRVLALGADGHVIGESPTRSLRVP